LVVDINDVDTLKNDTLNLTVLSVINGVPAEEVTGAPELP
jgi:hypothetical protein